MKVPGLGYEPHHFTFGDLDIVHAAISHVDPMVRANAPVWLPHIAPVPLCGLGGTARRQPASSGAGPLCRACEAHLRELDDWVRQAEGHLAATGPSDVSVVHSRVHALPL